MLLVLRHSLFLVVVMFSFLYANLFSVFVSCILLKKNYLVLPHLDSMHVMEQFL